MPKPPKLAGVSAPPPRGEFLSLVAQKIHENALIVNERASALSQRIVDFEEWLRALPGKVPASCWIDAPDDSSSENLLGLRFERQGQWRLQYAFQKNPPIENEDSLSWNSLSDAPVDIKIAAAGMFLGLLDHILSNQIRRAEQLKEVNHELDAFSLHIGLRTAKEANNASF